MKMSKSQKYLAVLLAIVLLYVAIEVSSNWQQYKSYYFSNSGQNRVVKPVVSTYGNLHTKNFAEQHMLNWKGDPFKLAVRQIITTQKKLQSRSDTKLKLKAITKDATNAFVMINESILMEGEIIRGYRIEKIYPDKVELSINGQYSYIYLDKEGK